FFIFSDCSLKFLSFRANKSSSSLKILRGSVFTFETSTSNGLLLQEVRTNKEKVKNKNKLRYIFILHLCKVITKKIIMKKFLCVFVSLLFTASFLRAQSNEFDKKWRFGLRVTPQPTWFSSGD